MTWNMIEFYMENYSSKFLVQELGNHSLLSPEGLRAVDHRRDHPESGIPWLCKVPIQESVASHFVRVT